ncbi:hypothetical protein QOZ80_8BG0644020 [Eleusine coracana subsp. coracana]|nr:hypothetical protein QOZ80_8BG0644020 [Eleusine coracana subsp. coracana]
MAQASAWALLRRLRRHRDPAAALLRRRLLSSVSESSSPGSLPGTNHLGVHGGSRGLSAWVGSHPRPRHPRRQHVAATATRAAHQAASRYRPPLSATSLAFFPSPEMVVLAVGCLTNLPFLSCSSESPVAAASTEAGTVASHSEAVPLIKSAFGKLEGQNHCWLNATNGIWRSLNEEGIYLILLYRSCETLNSNGKCSSAFEKLKYLQRRYPHLNVFAMQYGRDTSSLAAEIEAVHTLMEEYITFPILRTDKDFSNMTGPCYLLLEGSKDPVLFSKSHEEPEVMIKAIEELTGLKEEPSENVLSRVSWQKEESFKEPCVGSFRNLLLYHPACLSVDEDGDRIFISDSNHHRIVISNSDGMVMDSIGSLPGFEDGEFESAKFLRPAASFYHTSEDCLYIVDSENHAIRKADLERRIVETVYPVFNKSSGILSWIIDKLGLKKEVAPNIQDFDADLVALPWHLLQISEDNLLVADRRFEVPWILKISTGEKLDIGRGRAEVMESYEQIVNERCTLLKDVHTSWSSSAKEHSDSLEKIPNEELVSSVSRFQNNTVFCDKDGQRVLKHNLGTKNTSTIQFSNCEVLGLPYWFVCNLERVSTWGRSTGQFQEHIRQVDVLPGKCNITVYVDIPADTELAAPLAENCIWRQVRGSGAEISGSDGPETTTEKVGIAQQWYDELDNLAFSEVAEEPAAHEGDDKPADQSYQDQRTVNFTCTVNVSPGTCELVASAALYLKIARTTSDHEEQKAAVKRIMGCHGREENAGVELLMGRSSADARDLVVAKPVHLRLRLLCTDHPAGATNKETINTESSLKINISLG